MGRTLKARNLLQKIRNYIQQGRYLDTYHANIRQNERNITRDEVLYVLTYGHHEAKKDKYEIQFNAWNYAIRGKTLDGRDLRIVVSFDAHDLLIITAIGIK